MNLSTEDVALIAVKSARSIFSSLARLLILGSRGIGLRRVLTRFVTVFCGLVEDAVDLKDGGLVDALFSNLLIIKATADCFVGEFLKFASDPEVNKCDLNASLDPLAEDGSESVYADFPKLFLRVDNCARIAEPLAVEVLVSGLDNRPRCRTGSVSTCPRLSESTGYRKAMATE